MSAEESASELRLIGQDLEALDLRDFRVDWADGVYTVSGQAMVASAEDAPPEGRLARLWWNLTKDGVVTGQPRLVDIERTYSATDLDRVKTRVIDQRDDRPQRAAPDSYSPSQILRVIGAFVDSKQGRFRGFGRHGRRVRIEYEDSSGQLQSDEQPFSQLLDFSHYLYRQRNSTDD